MPKRSTKIAEKVSIVISVTQEEKSTIEREASGARQTVSSFILAAVKGLVGAPRFGGVPMFPNAGYMVLPTGVDQVIFIPRGWEPDDLRRAADFYDGLNREEQ